MRSSNKTLNRPLNKTLNKTNKTFNKVYKSPSINKSKKRSLWSFLGFKYRK